MASESLWTTGKSGLRFRDCAFCLEMWQDMAGMRVGMAIGREGEGRNAFSTPVCQPSSTVSLSSYASGCRAEGGGGFGWWAQSCPLHPASWLRQYAPIMPPSWRFWMDEFCGRQQQVGGLDAVTSPLLVPSSPPPSFSIRS